MFKTFHSLFVALFILSFGTTTAAPHEVRKDNVCTYGIYGDLTPLLQHYYPAKAWCQAYYPAKCSRDARQKRQISSSTTKTQATVAIKTSTSNQKAESTQASTKMALSSAARFAPSNTPGNGPTTTAVDVMIAAFAKATRQQVNILSTLCSCIIAPQVSHAPKSMVRSALVERDRYVSCTGPS